MRFNLNLIIDFFLICSLLGSARWGHEAEVCLSNNRLFNFHLLVKINRLTHADYSHRICIISFLENRLHGTILRLIDADNLLFEELLLSLGEELL